jgi:hypothetical protein
MTGDHPSDERLLLYAEGERTDLVAAHLEACESCRRLVAEVEAGREALRSTPLLEFPADRREAVLAALPRRERTIPVRRFLAVAVPMTAVAAVVAVVALTGAGQGDPERTAEQMAADVQRDEAAALEAAPAEEGILDDAPLLTVEGPADEVVAFLRERGFDARVQADGVMVAGAEPGDGGCALERRPAGPLPVYLQP